MSKILDVSDDRHRFHLLSVEGAAHLRRSRLGAYRWLERSVLFGQVLLFWQDQLAAMVQLVWSLLLLAALRYAIRQEGARLGLELIRDSADAWH
jgi:hypothetical protein